jgi:hypothetical protein
MGVEKVVDQGWNEWQNILRCMFEYRFSAIGEKGNRMIQPRKAFTALFLQAQGFKVPTPDILLEAAKLISKGEVNDSVYDSWAMLGHRFGIVENLADLQQYFQAIRGSLKPGGQVLITSIFSDSTLDYKSNLNPGSNRPVALANISSLQFQHENLIGPYFNLLSFRAETLKSQARMATWQCQVIHQQDDNNYVFQLSLPETGK